LEKNISIFQKEKEWGKSKKSQNFSPPLQEKEKTPFPQFWRFNRGMV
jgi:hypothetical protein